MLKHNKDLADGIKAFLDDRFEGFVVVGFRADNHTPFIIVNDQGSEMKRRALWTLTDQVNDMMPPEDVDEDDEEEEEEEV